MSILLASRQKVLNTHEAIPIPMPQLDDSDVMIWSLEADFLAVYEDARETASGTRHDLASCIWSSRYSMCQQGLATESLRSSCLSLLFFGNLSRQSRFVTSSLLNFPSWNALSICALGSGWFYPTLNSDCRLWTPRVRGQWYVSSVHQSLPWLQNMYIHFTVLTPTSRS